PAPRPGSAPRVPELSRQCRIRSHLTQKCSSAAARARARGLVAHLLCHAVPAFMLPGAAALGDVVVVDVCAVAIPIAPASIAAAINAVPVIRMRLILSELQISLSFSALT